MLNCRNDALGDVVEAFVGLHKDADQSFTWTDGSIVDFMYQITYDIASTERCGYLVKASSTDFTFSHKDCSGVKMPYVCQVYLGRYPGTFRQKI